MLGRRLVLGAILLLGGITGPVLLPEAAFADAAEGCIVNALGHACRSSDGTQDIGPGGTGEYQSSRKAQFAGIGPFTISWDDGQVTCLENEVCNSSDGTTVGDSPLPADKVITVTVTGNGSVGVASLSPGPEGCAVNWLAHVCRSSDGTLNTGPTPVGTARLSDPGGGFIGFGPFTISWDGEVRVTCDPNEFCQSVDPDVPIPAHKPITVAVPAAPGSVIAGVPFAMGFAPSDLRATADSQTQIDLAWQDNSSLEGDVHIERSLNGAEFTEIATVTEDETSFGDRQGNVATPLTCDDTAVYRVRAHIHGGEEGQFSAYSDESSDTTGPCDPSGLGVTAVSQTQIDLAWSDNSTTETSYRVERSADGGVTWTEIASLLADTTSFSDVSLACDQTRIYRVRAHNLDAGAAGLFSEFSNEASGTTSPCVA